MFDRLEFDRFHREEVPRLLAAHGALAVAAGGAGLRPLAFRLPDGRAWTYTLDGDALRVAPGDGAHTVVELTEADWSDFVTETRTCFGLLYAGLVSFPHGGFEHLDRWEPALRALYAGRPPYDPAAVADLDLTRSFRIDEAEEAAAFLQRAGFVHLRAVFDEDETAVVRREVERLQLAARPDDARSWWARDGAGTEICCRLIYTAGASEPIARFVEDDRLAHLAALAGHDLVATNDRLDGVSVVVKDAAAVEGLSDLPWHRDCGLGGHPVLCPTVLIGIQLDRASRETGQLRFLAGSHLTTGSPPAPGQEGSLPIVGIDADPGDVTVHFGHVLHVAPPPEAAGTGRRTMYVGFSNPAVLDVVPPGRGYNDVLFTGLADGHVPGPADLVPGGSVEAR